MEQIWKLQREKEELFDKNKCLEGLAYDLVDQLYYSYGEEDIDIEKKLEKLVEKKRKFRIELMN